MNEWSVTAWRIDRPGYFDVLYKGPDFNLALEELTKATYEYLYVRMEYHL
jgi:hypothetical protein